MADPVLKGVLDAIAESDNEAAGQLITRLRESHIHGREDGQLTTAAPTQLTSPVGVFKAGDVGKLLDLIERDVGTPHGFEGTYVVASFVDVFNVTLDKIDGSAPSFTNTTPVRWRFSTVRVETTLELKERDRQMQVWVGEEPAAIPYAQLVKTAGAQEIRGLGPNRLQIYGDIDSTAPATVSTAGAFFVAADVGRTLWILPPATPNGNEGPQLITAVAGDGKSCTVSPGGLAADEPNAWFVVKDYAGAQGYLTGLRPPSKEIRPLESESPVVDGSQSFSGLDQLRRALLTDYAEADELDRIGRNLAVIRPRGMSDETYRCLLQVLSYLPKATVYGLELVLECLFPGGGYSIYEDLIGFPNTVFILIEAITGNSVDFEGKTFMAPTGADVTPPIDPSKAGGAALGRQDREKQTSSSTTSVTVAHDPITVNDILRDDSDLTAEMTTLPTADTPAWTYLAQNSATEGQVFSLTSNGSLAQTQPGAPTDEGGYYRRTPGTLELPGALERSIFEVSAWFRVASTSSEQGYPWGFYVSDDSIDAQYGLWWDSAGAVVGADPGLPLLSVTFDQPLAVGVWHHFRLRRETIGGQYLISGFLDGRALFDEVDSSIFPSTTVDLIAFGYFYQAATSQNWTAEWDRVRLFSRDGRNYYNLSDNDGFFSGGDDSLVSGSGGFLASDAAGDGKRIRIHTVGNGGEAARVNLGLWNVKSYVSATEVELEGILSGPIVAVLTDGSDNFVDLLDPLFVSADLNKQLEIFGSATSNNGTRKVLEVVSSKRVRVDGAAFSPEDELSFRFNVFDGTTAGQFKAAGGFTWELVDAGTKAGSVLTLREALPQAATPVQVWYTSVLSAQLTRNTFVTNQGSLGAEPNIYYPMYIFDVDRATRQLMDEITAAGVIPEFEREF